MNVRKTMGSRNVAARDSIYIQQSVEHAMLRTCISAGVLVYIVERAIFPDLSLQTAKWTNTERNQSML